MIKDTVKKIFFEEGRFFATTQEIADDAGISRASIHYYYRSRRKLFDQVIYEESLAIRNKLDGIFGEELSLRKRTEGFIDFYIEKSIRLPYLELFIIAEFNTGQKNSLNLLNQICESFKIRELKKGN